MNDKISYDMGSVGNLAGQLKISICIDEQREGGITLYASQPSDLRISGVILTLDKNGYDDLKAIFHQANAALANLQKSNPHTVKTNRNFQRRLGSVISIVGSLSFSIVGNAEQSSRIQIYASDPTNLRKQGVLITLRDDQRQLMNELLDSVDKTIDELIETDEMARMRKHDVFNGFNVSKKQRQKQSGCFLAVLTIAFAAAAAFA